MVLILDYAAARVLHFSTGPLSLHSRIACRATDARRVQPSTSALAPEDLQEHQDQLVTTRDYAD